jgi:3-methyladenine DNA glycosylase/8-oxoguanine DNA glycosylase
VSRDVERATTRSLWRPTRPTDLVRTLGVLARGPFDPSMRRDESGAYWRASRTPVGAATTRYRETVEGIEIESYGPGAEWAVAHAPELLGDRDDAEGFAPSGRLADLHRRFPGIRMVRTKAVYEATLRAVCEQLVSGLEANRTYAQLAARWGEVAPGPFALRLPPLPEVMAKLPFHDLRAVGLEMKRAKAAREAARLAARLEETSEMPRDKAYARLEAVRGIGPWTAAEVAAVAWGDADAVSVGDFHLKNVIVFAFTGGPRGTDEHMLELLEPFRPHRARVIRLIQAAGISAPRFGPRRPLRDW